MSGENDGPSVVIPQLRNQQYEFRELPANIVQQQLDKEAMIVD